MKRAGKLGVSTAEAYLIGAGVYFITGREHGHWLSSSVALVFAVTVGLVHFLAEGAK